MFDTRRALQYNPNFRFRDAPERTSRACPSCKEQFPGMSSNVVPMPTTEMPPPVPPDTEAHSRILHSQLERMRAMHYKYSELFYNLITIAFVALILMTAASLTETLRATALLIPFFTIWTGLQSAYYLSYTVFARVYATGLEKTLNQLHGTDLLIAHRIEAEYLFPLRGNQFAGVPLRFAQTLIGFLTLHFWLTGAAVIGLSAYRAWQLLPELAAEFPPVRFYFVALALWSLLHLVYLVWYFGTRRYEHAIMRIVGEALDTTYDRA